MSIYVLMDNEYSQVLELSTSKFNGFIEVTLKENTIDSDSWSDPYGDERAYYDGWSREDVESGLADAYE